MWRPWLEAFEGCIAVSTQAVFFTQKARAEPGLRGELEAGQAAVFLSSLSRWPAGPSSEHDNFREVRILKCGHQSKCFERLREKIQGFLYPGLGNPHIVLGEKKKKIDVVNSALRW